MSKERFDGHAKAYTVGRPDYAEALIECLYSGYDYRSFDHPLCLDKEMFVARSLSASYSLKEGDVKYKAYMEAIMNVFNRYEDNGSVVIGNKSVAYIGSTANFSLPSLSSFSISEVVSE